MNIINANAANYGINTDALNTQYQEIKTAAQSIPEPQPQPEVKAASIDPSNYASTAYAFFVNKGYTAAGTAGLLGNLYAESGINPHNLKNTANAKLGLSDEEFTAKLDSGEYKLSNFYTGYGLAQWTSPERRAGLESFAAEKGTSVSDFITQLEYIDYELQNNYGSVYKTLTTTDDVKAASNAVLTKYEMPSDMSSAVQNTRLSYALRFVGDEKLEKIASTPDWIVNTVNQGGVANGNIGVNKSISPLIDKSSVAAAMESLDKYYNTPDWLINTVNQGGVADSIGINPEIAPMIDTSSVTAALDSYNAYENIPNYIKDTVNQGGVADTIGVNPDIASKILSGPTTVADALEKYETYNSFKVGES